MGQELIERYVYAVSRALPQRVRADIERELRGLIEDMLQERCGELPPTERDVRVVLTELGTPQEMAERYSPEGERCLIGPPYFVPYRTVLKIVLPSVLFGLTLAAVLGALTGDVQPHWLAAAQWLASTAGGAIFAFGFVTLLFAIFQRRGVKLDSKGDALDLLPPVPRREETVKRFEQVLGIVVSVLFATVFLAVPQILGAYIPQQGGFVPIFDARVVRAMWPLVLGIAAVGILRDSFRLYEGQYTWRLGIVTLTADAVNAVLSVLLLLDGRIVNPQFTAAMTSLFQGEEAWLNILFTDLSKVLLAVVLFALVLDACTALWRAWRYAGTAG